MELDMPGNGVRNDDAVGMAIGTSQHYVWLKGVATALLLLNLIDGVFTLFWVHTGLAEEGNILLQDLVYGDALLFMGIKLTLVSLGAIYLWINRNHPLAVCALFLSFLAYYVVLLYHLHYGSLVLL